MRCGVARGGAVPTAVGLTVPAFAVGAVVDARSGGVDARSGGGAVAFLVGTAVGGAGGIAVGGIAVDCNEGTTVGCGAGRAVAVGAGEGVAGGRTIVAIAATGGALAVAVAESVVVAGTGPAAPGPIPPGGGA